MPSPIIEQIRQQFYASLGINDSTPISDAQAPALIDQWEQYLFASAQQGYQQPYPGYPSGYSQYPPPNIPIRPGMPSPINYVPSNQRGPVYVSPGGPGSTPARPNQPVRLVTRVAPPVAAPSGGGVYVNAPGQQLR